MHEYAKSSQIEKDIALLASQTNYKEAKSKSQPKLEYEDKLDSDEDNKELTSEIVNLVKKMIKK